MNAAKRKGTEWENAVVRYLSRFWPHAERRAQSGVNDKGDISGLIGVCIECKNHAGWKPQEWLRELDTEMVNAAAQIGCVFVKSRGKASADDGVVMMRPDVFVRLLREAGY